MRRSLITFPFIYYFFTTSNCSACAAVSLYTGLSLQQCIYIAHVDTACRNGSKLSCCCYWCCPFCENEKKLLFKSRRVNLKNRGKVKVIFCFACSWLFIKISFSLGWFEGFFDSDDTKGDYYKLF